LLIIAPSDRFTTLYIPVMGLKSHADSGTPFPPEAHTSVDSVKTILHLVRMLVLTSSLTSLPAQKVSIPDPGLNAANPPARPWGRRPAKDGCKTDRGGSWLR